jgi:hypothetical protein
MTTVIAPPGDDAQTQSPDVPRADWLAEYPPARSLLLDQQALRIYELAYAIGLKGEPPKSPPITFTSVLLALLVGKDDTSRWFADATREHGPDAAAVLSEKKLAHSEVVSLSPKPGKPEPVQLSEDRQLLTVSARAVIENAERWAQKVGGSDIGVRHLVAAYVLNPPQAHGAQMRKWKYRETTWRPVFFRWVASHYTAEQWADASHRPAPTKSIAEFEQQPVKGEALGLAGDDGIQAVLESAAAYHARAADPFLRLRTVFCALAETARHDAGLRAAIQPLWTAVESAGDQYVRARDGFFPDLGTAPVVTPFATLDISPRVLNALETARELALATRPDTPGELRIGTLELAGALLSHRVDGEGELGAFGVKSQELRLALISHAEKRGDSGEVWRDALGVEESGHVGRPVDLSSDEPEAVVRLDEKWTSDPLAIRGDVETFAALLASRTLEPPLSIGLFGPWGSGKTTFLKRLRRTVESRAEDARRAVAAGRESDYVSNVVHVDFNAWHFAEGPLVSSLVDTILRELSRYIKKDAPIGGKAWSLQKHEALESTKRQVEAAKAVEQAAQAAVTVAEQALADFRAKAAKAATGVQATLQSVWTATTAALMATDPVRDSGVLEAVGTTVRSAEELRERLNAVRSRPARLLGDLGLGRSLLFAGLVLVVPAFVAWLVGRVLAGGLVAEAASTVAAVVSVGGMWLRSASGAVAKVDRAVTRVADEYARRIEQDSGVVNARAALENAQAAAATAAAGAQAAREALARARTEAANATLPAQMLQLVSSRIGDQSYSKDLTTLSLARADLEALSHLIYGRRNRTAADAPAGDASDPAAPPPPRAVDRIILYIDDLDRCKPEDVVRVLQLVHMLLAFELFVVVVAVDARWVEESLRNSYKWLAAEAPEADRNGDPGTLWPGRSGRVTPQDYLEKIFQIAFWLEPMTAGRAASYLGSLVPAASREPDPVYQSATTPGQAPDPAPPVREFAKVGIAGIELDYMRALAAYVGSSPRRVKRLVNAYRLIKAGMSDAQLTTFLTDRAADDGGIREGPYQIVIGLLVIGTGAPASSAQIMKELSEWDPTDGFDQVVERFRARNQPDWNMAARVIETLIRTQKPKNVSEIRGWARKVGRFLLNGPGADRLAGGVQAPVTPY